MKLSIDNSSDSIDCNRSSYFEKDVVINSDPLLLAGQLSESSLSDTFVIYEDNGKWSIGIGEAATVVTDDRKTTLNINGQTQEWVTRVPVESTHLAFAALPMTNWQAYGIVNYSLARKNYGLDLDEAEKELLRFFVPIYEIRIQENRALLRAIDEEKLLELSALVAGIDSSIFAENKNPFAARINERSLDFSSVDDGGVKDYYKSVAGAVGEIREKKYSKVILSRVIPLADKVDIVASYISGRRANTPARSFLLKLDGLEAAGFSPETVLVVDKEGWVSTRPLAGTRSLGASPEEELRLRKELLSDSKEIYEHAISVQLAVAELKKVCTDGSVFISDFMDIVRRKSVQHIASCVRGRLAEGKSAWQALDVLFPGVTATGIPKQQAIDAIGRLEAGPRHLYSGCVVMLDSSGIMDAAIVLRSVFQKNEKGWLQVGAGIIENSSPSREVEETREKVGSVARFLVSSK